MPVFDPNAGFKVYKGDKLIYTNAPSAPSGSFGGSFGDVLAWFMKNENGMPESEADKVKGLKLDAVAASKAYMNIITSSLGMMHAIAYSKTAMGTMASSFIAMGTIAFSFIAMGTIASSFIAMKAVASSETAMNAIAASDTAMKAVASSPFLSDTGWLHEKEGDIVKTFKRGKTIVFEVYTKYDSLDSNFYQDSVAVEESSPRFSYYPSCKYPNIKQPGQILNKGLTLVALPSNSSDIRVKYL